MNLSMVLPEWVRVCRRNSLSCEASGSREERWNQTRLGIRRFGNLLLRSLWVGPFRSFPSAYRVPRTRGLKAELFLVREETVRPTASSVLCVPGAADIFRNCRAARTPALTSEPSVGGPLHPVQLRVPYFHVFSALRSGAKAGLNCSRPWFAGY
jgi:hypothetical protein